MSSQRRIESSRRNGARSRGPKTAAGKSRSSINATRHGLLAQRVVLQNESRANFDQLFGHYLHKFSPHDGVEIAMIEEMTACYWRLHRALSIEREMFDQAFERSTADCRPAATVQAWNELASSPGFQLMHRYQSMLHRMHQRALNNILILRDIEPDDTPLPNEPSPMSGHSGPAAPRPAAIDPEFDPELVLQDAEPA